MSDVRFACPFCTQHIACDRSYAGTPIDCPSCGSRIIVPQPLAVSSDRIPNAVAVPAEKSRDLGVWTEEAWRDHLRRTPGNYALNDSRWPLPRAPVFLAMVLPALVLFGATRPILWVAIVIGALISGILMRREVGTEASAFTAGTAFVGGVFFFAVFAEVFLLGGCCWPSRLQNL